MSLLEIEPKQNQRVIDLIEQAGLDISDWSNFKGGTSKAASNPRYCYEWCFIDGNLIVLNLWHDQLELENDRVYRQFNMRELSKKDSKLVWKNRARRMDNAIRMAYESQLPIRVILASGIRRASDDLDAEASKINKRLLDPMPWAVASYEVTTGDCILERGLTPILPIDESYFIDQNDSELPEGELRERLTKHRKREGRLRRRKIDEALFKNNGRLVCEVPNCNFDFIKIYGAIGEGYAQVHHKIPLNEFPIDGRNTKLEDLAIVCANCHVMIHRNGECRSIETLIPTRKAPKD